MATDKRIDIIGELTQRAEYHAEKARGLHREAALNTAKAQVHSEEVTGLRNWARYVKERGAHAVEPDREEDGDDE